MKHGDWILESRRKGTDEWKNHFSDGRSYLFKGHACDASKSGLRSWGHVFEFRVRNTQSNETVEFFEDCHGY